MFLRELLKRPAIQQFIRYVIVGCIVTAIDMATLHVFFHILNVAIKISVVVGFMCGNISSFVLNKYFTFQNFSSSIVRQYAKYLLTSMTGLLWTVFLMSLFFEQLGLFAGISKYNYLLCKMLVAVLVMFWNFMIIRNWTLASYSLGSLQSFDDDEAKEKTYLSVVIPAYNEQTRLPATMQQVVSWLQKQTFSWELIVVDDGSTDQTVQSVRKLYPDLPNLIIHSLGVNCGKGAAVKTGMLMANGEYRLFLDADHQIHIDELAKFLQHADDNTVIIGSKYMNKTKGSREDAKISFARKMVSRIGNLIIRVLLNLPINDTQCGFKLFPGKVADNVFRLQTLKGFSFDVEVLTLATLFQVKIIELPIVLYEAQETRVKALRDSLNVFIDLVHIKMNIWKKKYKNQQQAVQPSINSSDRAK